MKKRSPDSKNQEKQMAEENEKLQFWLEKNGLGNITADMEASGFDNVEEVLTLELEDITTLAKEYEWKVKFLL